MTFDDVFFVDGGDGMNNDSNNNQMVRIGENVTVTRDGGAASSNRVVLEWVSGSSNDLIADAVIALILLENDFGGGEEDIKEDIKEEDMIRVLERVLHAQFGETRVETASAESGKASVGGKVFVDVEGKHVIVELSVGKKGSKGSEVEEVKIEGWSVTCADGALKMRVEKAVARLLRCLRKNNNNDE